MQDVFPCQFGIEFSRISVAAHTEESYLKFVQAQYLEGS
jgi:hypothetical protein